MEFVHVWVVYCGGFNGRGVNSEEEVEVEDAEDAEDAGDAEAEALEGDCCAAK